MTTNKDWKQIKEEFKKKYFHRGIPGYELRHVEMCEEFLDFFKPYFQERLHEEAVEELECYCSDDRSSGYYSNGHFSSCPQYPKAQKIITCHLCKRSYTKDLTVNNFTPLTQFCSECGQGFVDNNPKE